MLARICAFLSWALVAASVVFWGLRLLVAAPASPAATVAVDSSAALRGDLTRLFGATSPALLALPTAVESPSRFHLVGIMAPRPNSGAGQGVALIVVDGKPARAFRVGARIDDDLVLQSVSLRAASIGSGREGGTALTLQMPPLSVASTGTLTPLNGAGGFVPLGGGAPVPWAHAVPNNSFPTGQPGLPPTGAPPRSPFGGGMSPAQQGEATSQ